MEHLLATWGYLALFGATLISSMGIPVGSEIAIAYGGALASGQIGGQVHLDLAAVILVALAGELVGSAAGYAVGFVGGRPLVDRLGKYVLLTHRDLDRAERWFDGRGESVVLFARLIPLVRSFISLAAGLAEMALGKFSLFTVLGCGILVHHVGRTGLQPGEQLAQGGKGLQLCRVPRARPGDPGDRDCLRPANTGCAPREDRSRSLRTRPAGRSNAPRPPVGRAVPSGLGGTAHWVTSVHDGLWTTRA